MKQLSFFKGLLIGGILAASIWTIAIVSISSILNTDAPTEITAPTPTVIYASNPPA